MKILFLSSRYPPNSIGGAERVAHTLATALKADGDDGVVLTTAVIPDEADRFVDGIRVRPIPLANVYDFSRPGARLLKPLWHAIDCDNRFMRERVARMIREEAPDVVHTHLITGFSPSAWD